MKQNPSAPDNVVRQVLIVVKKTTYQQEILEKHDAQSLKLIDHSSPSVAQWERTHREHMEALAVVKNGLSRRGIQFRLIDRNELSNQISDCDLVISFGGDGTFLETSHYLTGSIPLLGVNSAPATSHGHWCMARKDNFEAVLEQIASGAMSPLSLLRLQVAVNGKVLPVPVINELFIGHPSPAGTSRYLLEIRGKREEHRCSGLIVGPACGSTGWIRSAGGLVLPATARQIQYLVREPCLWPGEGGELLRGLLDSGDKVKVIPIMPQGKIFIDGQHVSYDIARGDEIVVSAYRYDLLAYIASDVNERYATELAAKESEFRIVIVQRTEQWTGAVESQDLLSVPPYVDLASEEAAWFHSGGDTSGQSFADYLVLRGARRLEVKTWTVNYQ